MYPVQVKRLKTVLEDCPSGLRTVSPVPPFRGNPISYFRAVMHWRKVKSDCPAKFARLLFDDRKRNGLSLFKRLGMAANPFLGHSVFIGVGDEKRIGRDLANANDPLNRGPVGKREWAEN